jgi:hypothetical protein
MTARSAQARPGALPGELILGLALGYLVSRTWELPSRSAKGRGISTHGRKRSSHYNGRVFGRCKVGQAAIEPLTALGMQMQAFEESRRIRREQLGCGGSMTGIHGGPPWRMPGWSRTLEEAGEPSCGNPPVVSERTEEGSERERAGDCRGDPCIVGVRP